MPGVIDALFRDGHLADILLLFMAAEFAVLTWRGHLRGRPGTALELVFAIGPGACLVLALRAALTNAGPLWIAAAVTAALPLHLGDLARRRL